MERLDSNHQPTEQKPSVSVYSTNVVDKSKIFDRWNALGPIVLDLGCGPNKRHENWVGIDQTNYHCVDIQGDVFEILPKIADNSVDHVFSSHFFEHIDDVSRLVKEITRVLKPGGTMKVIVPHFSNPYFYSDYTHQTFFGLYSFSYFAKDDIYTRRTPMYQDFSERLALIDAQLVFKSTRPFYFRYAIKQLFGLIFNSSRYMQEYYEDMFSNFISCYEIHFTVKKEY